MPPLSGGVGTRVEEEQGMNNDNATASVEPDPRSLSTPELVTYNVSRHHAEVRPSGGATVAVQGMRSPGVQANS